MASSGQGAGKGIGGASGHSSGQMGRAGSVASVSTVRTGSSIQIFDKEKKKGDKGKALTVFTNYVAMDKRPNQTVKQYRVDFEPPEDHTFLKKRLMNCHTERLGAFIFDGAMMYKTEDLPDLPMVLQASFNQSVQYKITIRKVGEVPPDHDAFLQFYNTIMRKTMHLLDFEEMGRNFYNRHQQVVIEGAPLELWPGYITAIRNHDAGVLLCAEVTHKVLSTTSVLDLIREILGRVGNVARAEDAIRKEVVGQIVITHYNKKTYRIDEIDFKSTPIATFPSKQPDGSTKEITYQEYYLKRYGLRIPEEEMLQPLLVSNPRKKDINKGMKTNIYLIPSLCNLTGLSDNQRKDYRLMQKMADHLHMDPTKRKTRLEEFMKDMKNNSTVQKEFANWDVEFNPEFLTAVARILPGEDIHLSKRNGDLDFIVHDLTADWTNALKRHHMLSRKPLTDWVIIHPLDETKNVPPFLSCLTEQAALLGMEVRPPMAMLSYNSRHNVNDQMIVNLMAKYAEMTKFVLFVLPNNQLQRYAAIKKLFVLRYRIATQCYLQKNLVSKNLNSIASKVAIQINAKLGGIPWGVKIPFKTKVMILGFDVYHCAERKNYSAGALVATISENLGKYFSVVSFHQDKSELSSNMCIDTKKCLEAFKHANGEYPDRIIMYRDGVGEGQIPFVMEYEVKMMEQGIKELYSQDKLDMPKFTFIITTKKINTRFMAMPTRGKVCNPPPGTVLDSVVTIPDRFDFFLVSQSVRQGTVSPTNYNIIFDNSGLTANSLQQLTYKLCHMYYNWSGTVAVPAPCQYAHKLAYLTGVAVSDPAPQELSNVLWYL